MTAPSSGAGATATRAPTPTGDPRLAVLFGAAAGRALRFAELLAGPGVTRGLVGPREVDRLWDRHLFNCAPVAGLIPRDSTLADLGSGAGLPGIVVALLRPDVSVTLIESQQRRAGFLRECVVELGLDNVAVWRGRAQEVDPARRWPAVTARAVAPLRELLPLARPLLGARGSLYAIKGSRAREEIAAARQQIVECGIDSVHVHELGAPLLKPATTVVVLRVGAVAAPQRDPQR